MKRAQDSRSEDLSESGRHARQAQQALRAYVLIQIVPGRVEGIARTLRRMPAVRSVDAVTGPYDIVALVEVNELRDFSHLVAGSIGGLRGVTRTTTLICT